MNVWKRGGVYRVEARNPPRSIWKCGWRQYCHPKTLTITRMTEKGWEKWLVLVRAGETTNLRVLRPLFCHDWWTDEDIVWC